MMEHVLMHDWYDNKSSDDTHFVQEEDIDNCAIERILRNEFHDPLASSESEDEVSSNNINWDRIFKKRKQPSTGKLFVPCLKRSPPHPRVSELNSNQHKQFLKILSAEYPDVLKNLCLGKPNKQDVKAFEAAKETYLKEQKAYQEWAKTLWVTDHCIRALRPGPIAESVYDAECQMKAQRMQAFPKHYNIAAHITLENSMNNCDAVHKQDLISVTLEEMPNVQIPDKINKQLSINRPLTVPKPCQKHQYPIVLPNEDALSMLPITEIHRVLATFARSNNTSFIASENALKCLTQWNRHWLIPISVCDTSGPGGNRVRVLVLDSEFTVHKEAAHMRTYKAFRHLLEHALIPLSEKQRILEIEQDRAIEKEEKVSPTSPKLDVSTKPASPPIAQDVDLSSDDEDHLFIDTGEELVDSAEQKFTGFDSPKPNAGSEPSTLSLSPKAEFDEPSTSFGLPPAKRTRRSARVSHHVSESPAQSLHNKVSKESPAVPEIGVYSCTCKGTQYENPPRRSFKKWQLKNESSHEKLDVIIHCPHKAKDETGELLLEPLPEYQLDVGASEQTPDAVRSVALALALRKNSSLLNVRVDGATGNIATFEKLTSEAFAKKHPDVTRQVISTVQVALSQLHELKPGHYLLQHDPKHGPNAMLMCPTSPGQKHTLELNLDPDELIRVDEAEIAKLPPTITTALLPYHKYRRVLPCAFTHYENMVAKQTKKPPPKMKAPPPPHKKKAPPRPTIKYPKRKRKKNNRW